MPEEREKTGSEEVKVQEKKNSRPPLVRIIIIFSLIIILLNGAIIVKRGLDSYQESINDGKAYTERLTHTLADHVELTFSSVDLVLKRAVERQYFNTLFGNNLIEDMQNNIKLWVDETPQISAMLMTGEDGKVGIIHNKRNYKAWMQRKSSVITEPYFSNHSQSHDSDLLYVGWKNSWVDSSGGFVIMSRRLNKLSGDFGGIVLAAINSEYVSKFFHSIEAGKKTKLVLLREDGLKLISQMSDEEELLFNRIVEKNIIDSNKKIKILPGETVAIKEKGFDDQFRVFSFQSLPSTHMIAGVITYESDLLAGWWAARLNDVIFIAIFALFVLVISFFAVAIANQMRRVQRSESSAVLASQVKSEFLANMSHELRTPLNAIIGFSEMMESGYFGEMNEKQKERAHDINFCGNHLLELINDILEFSKGEAGKIELRTEKTDITKVIRDTVRIFEERARKNGVTVSTRIPEKIPMVMADERKIKQILMNLISNSVKFTSKNDTVEAACGVDDSGNLFLTVMDTGIGMAEKDIPKALSAFGQVHKNPIYGGTGLGLPLCKMFAELHGGSLLLQSIEGVGTKVTITLPASRIVWPHSKVEKLPTAVPDQKKIVKPKKTPDDKTAKKGNGHDEIVASESVEKEEEKLEA